MVEIDVDLEVDVDEVDKLELVLVDVLQDVIEQSITSRIEEPLARIDVLEDVDELKLIGESVVGINVDVGVDVEDVEKLELVVIDALEIVDGLELVGKSVIEVNVDVRVGVEIDVEN
eukprot:2117527-Amphidinium_carterae.1